MLWPGLHHWIEPPYSCLCVDQMECRWFECELPISRSRPSPIRAPCGWRCVFVALTPEGAPLIAWTGATPIFAALACCFPEISTSAYFSTSTPKESLSEMLKCRTSRSGAQSENNEGFLSTKIIDLVTVLFRPEIASGSKYSLELGTLHECQPASRSERATAGTDSPKRTSVPPPIAVDPVRCCLRCYVLRAKARCHGHADPGGLTQRHNRGRLAQYNHGIGAVQDRRCWRQRVVDRACNPEGGWRSLCPQVPLRHPVTGRTDSTPSPPARIPGVCLGFSFVASSQAAYLSGHTTQPVPTHFSLVERSGGPARGFVI